MPILIVSCATNVCAVSKLTLASTSHVLLSIRLFSVSATVATQVANWTLKSVGWTATGAWNFRPRKWLAVTAVPVLWRMFEMAITPYHCDAPLSTLISKSIAMIPASAWL